MKYGKIIDGNLIIEKGCVDDFSEVEEIKGSCYIYSNVEFPKLTTIGGSCDIHSNVEFKASKKLKNRFKFRVWNNCDWDEDFGKVYYNAEETYDCLGGNSCAEFDVCAWFKNLCDKNKFFAWSYYPYGVSR